MTPLFFESDTAPLYGVYHPPQRQQSPIQAVLLCSPVGQEYIRTHWCLRVMANQLARRGIHAFRFDYHGHGDSHGLPADINSIDQWVRNIHAATQELQRLSGAGTVMLIGLRLGATLAAIAAQQHQAINALVHWEPVCSGQTYLGQLRRMHARMLDLWYCPMQTPANEEIEEILGTTFSTSLLRQIESINEDFSSVVQPQLIVDLEARRSWRGQENDTRRLQLSADPDDWSHLDSLETAWLRPQTSGMIVSSVQDMFKRLDRFDALERPALAFPAAPNIPLANAMSTGGQVNV